MLPAPEIVTTSEPEVPVCVVHEAEHVDVFDELQVSVEVPFNRTDVGSADKVTIGIGVDGVPGVASPPPPPPPQATIKNVDIKIVK